jgi:hypothetical protein
MKAALESGDAERAADHHARCMRSLAGVNRELKAIGNRHADSLEGFANIARAMRSAAEAMQLDEDTTAVQTSSGGLHDDTGSRSDRRRRLRVLALAQPPI